MEWHRPALPCRSNCRWDVLESQIFIGDLMGGGVTPAWALNMPRGEEGRKLSFPKSASMYQIMHQLVMVVFYWPNHAEDEVGHS